MRLEDDFDPVFTTRLALREKQIQQNYRPIIGIHKWFARRPGTVFRNLLLAEFNGAEPADTSYWRAHAFRGVIADPFMGGGTPIFEAIRLGFSVVGTDINPMAYWVVRQALAPLDLSAFDLQADAVIADVEAELAYLYQTSCTRCAQPATVKYFLWVKVIPCPTCEHENDLFPGYLLAEATRHPLHVVVCGECGALNEYNQAPTKMKPEACQECGTAVVVEGPARKQRVQCRNCTTAYSYPPKKPIGPPKHRMWAMEYHCSSCKPSHSGRFFKRPDHADMEKLAAASSLLAQRQDLLIPLDEIPAGDETARLHRWGYRFYREMFNERQLLGLSILLRRILQVEEAEIRHALLTVFSDILRYQNMLCRYDTYALKCQDIFSVHGFPVGLVQCENNILGIPQVGAGGFRHFLEKYRRAKQYAETPFETRQVGTRKHVVSIPGEQIKAELVSEFPAHGGRQAQLVAAPAATLPLEPNSLDGVFTDPPYFDNVQYAELMDFCFVWLRLGLGHDIAAFRQGATTRNAAELTGNVTLGRGLDHFTAGLSNVFCHYAAALKPQAPFVFTYHHNSPAAYVPLVVAILDAGMMCTAALPAAAEMGASLHIAGTNSSVLDTIFVCRVGCTVDSDHNLEACLLRDGIAMVEAGVRVSEGDLRCLTAGHLARIAINRLRPMWDQNESLGRRMARAKDCLLDLELTWSTTTIVTGVLKALQISRGQEDALAKTI